MRYNKKFASQILQFNSQWEQTDKDTIATNIENILYEIHPECSTNWKEKIKLISEYTDTKPNTVFAWFNRGRMNVKVPMLKLCMIAETLNINVEKFLEVTEDIEEK